jgi:hypothetical protein
VARRARARAHLVATGGVGLLVAAGVVLLAAGLLIVGAGGGEMHRKMPFQVPPRRLAAIPLVAGGGLLTLAGLLALLP